MFSENDHASVTRMICSNFACFGGGGALKYAEAGNGRWSTTIP